MDEENEGFELPEDLTELTENELRETHEAILARITELRESDEITVADSRVLRELIVVANDIAALISESVAPIPDTEEVATTPPVAERRPAAPVAPAPEPVAEAEPEVAEPEAAAEELEPEAVAASIQVHELPASESEPPAPTGLEPAPFLASAAQAEFAQGAALDIDQVGELFERTTRDQYGSGKVRLASVERFVNGAPRLGSDKFANAELIENLPQHDPMTAAICGPLDIVRPIPDCVATGRPVRDIFRQVPAPRGAFQFMRSIGLADVSDAVQIWTDVDQAAVDPDDSATWKTCHRLVCETTIETEVEAISSCLQVDTKQEFSAPEQIANNISTIAALTDRVAEGELLLRVDTLASAYTWTGVYGALSSLYQMVATIIGRSMDVRRITNPDSYLAILPAGLLQQLGVDVMNRGFGSPCSCDEVTAAFANMGLRVVITPDFATGAASPWAAWALNPPGDAAVALPDAPTDWTIRIIDPSAGFFYETGRRNFGIERSPELSRQNLVQWFGEMFEGLDKQGCQPWFTVLATLCPSGSRAAQEDPSQYCIPPV